MDFDDKNDKLFHSKNSSKSNLVFYTEIISIQLKQWTSIHIYSYNS